MNSTEATLLVSEHLYGVPGILPDIGFETVNIFHLDFSDWEIDCKVFDMLTSRMVSYRVVISDDQVESMRRI